MLDQRRAAARGRMLNFAGLLQRRADDAVREAAAGDSRTAANSDYR